MICGIHANSATISNKIKVNTAYKFKVTRFYILKDVIYPVVQLRNDFVIR